MNGSSDLDLLFASLRFVTDVCDEVGIPYAVAGGMALAIWARPRATFDVDLVLGLPMTQADSIAQRLQDSNRFPFDPNVVSFGSRSLVRVHRLSDTDLGREVLVIDLLLFEAAFAESIASRRRRLTAIEGREYWFCSPEDLIVMKLIADRDQDQVDVGAILANRGAELELDYIERWAAHFGTQDVWRKRLSDWRAGLA